MIHLRKNNASVNVMTCMNYIQKRIGEELKEIKTEKLQNLAKKTIIINIKHGNRKWYMLGGIQTKYSKEIAC